MNKKTTAFVSLLATIILIGGGCFTQNGDMELREFTFDDLGFSIVLPFEQEDLVSNYTECDSDSACDKFGYSYSVILNDEYSVLQSVSEYWSPSRRSFFGDIYDVAVSDNTYEIIKPNGKSFAINPINIINHSGVDFYVFDSYDYFKLTEIVEDGEVVLSEGEPNSQYAAVFSLPENSKYKAAILTFNKEDLSLQELKEAIRTIQFHGAGDSLSYENTKTGVNFSYDSSWEFQEEYIGYGWEDGGGNTHVWVKFLTHDEEQLVVGIERKKNIIDTVTAGSEIEHTILSENVIVDFPSARVESKNLFTGEISTDTWVEMGSYLVKVPDIRTYPEVKTVIDTLQIVDRQLKRFVSEEHGIVFDYPDDWQAYEYDESHVPQMGVGLGDILIQEPETKCLVHANSIKDGTIDKEKKKKVDVVSEFSNTYDVTGIHSWGVVNENGEKNSIYMLYTDDGEMRFIEVNAAVECRNIVAQIIDSVRY